MFMRAKIRLFSENSKLKIQHSLYHCLYAIMCFPFCVVFRITFAKVLFCVGDVKYSQYFFKKTISFCFSVAQLRPDI